MYVILVPPHYDEIEIEDEASEQPPRSPRDDLLDED
jgi:hypothetical protein